ncbi:hypothetical protein DYB32_006817 [Aphanomyces invadans]|uniref:Uncharacterized protein n=1 Tax=Aphanomyces invadans TaxID=157072 RepID=A0A418AYJ9_9STRA|nr:hypothetical protein DYB32_006817 [Aphanomyces invadans]
MSLLKEVNASATVAWSPIKRRSNLIALGSKDGVGVGFESYGGELQLMSMDFTDVTPAPIQLGSIKTSSRFLSLSWADVVRHQSSMELGVLAGGMADGTVNIWDPSKIATNAPAEVGKVSRHKGPVNAVQFNPHPDMSHLLASGGGDGEVFVMSLDKLNAPQVYTPGFVLSSAKDNRTLLWDLFTGQPFFELPSNVAAQPVGGSFFSGGGGGQRRFNVQWSPKIPAVASACTFDGKVQVWGLTGSGTSAARAPKWTTRPVSATFGFGGKLVVTNARTPAQPQQQQYGQPKVPRPVHIHKITSDPSIVAGADLLEQALAQRNFQGHCDNKVANAKRPADKATWSFMKILFDRASARTQLLLHLGYDSDKIKADARTYLGKDEPLPAEVAPPMFSCGLGQVSAADVFGAAPPAETAPSHPTTSVKSTGIPTDTSKRIDGPHPPTYTEASESIIKRLVLVGDFEAAVDVCLANFQLSDALLLACQGGEELWTRTQEACLAAGKGRPFMKIVKAMMKRDLSSLVNESHVELWMETLAILTTYATGDEFGVLVDQLAAKLESHGDVASATLCYMCSFNVEKTVTAWVKEAAIESTSRDPVLVLQDLIEKISIFAQASDNPDQELSPEVASQFAAYASLYADVSCAIIRDRVYHAAPNPQVRPPPSPFIDTTPVATAPQQNNRTQYQHQPATPSYGQPAAGSAARGAYGGAAPQPAAAAYGHTAQYSQQQYNNSSYNQPQATAYPTPATPAYGAPAQTQYPSTYGNSAPVPTPVGGYGAAGGGYATAPAPTPAYGSAPTPAYGSAPQGTFGGAPTPSAYGANPAAPTQGYGATTPAYGAPPPAYGAQAAPYRAPSAASTPGTFGATGPPSNPGGFPPQGHATPGVGFGAPQQVNAPPPAAAVHGGFAQPTALPNPSSRISTIPVDISKGKADGFVSSVGNKDLIRKYGNSTNAILSPTETEKAAGFHNQPTTPAPAAPLGATDNVSADDMPIVQGFNDLVSLLENSQLSPIEAKQLPEIHKAKDLLFTKLNTGELAPNVVKHLHEMVQSFARSDFRTAGNLHTQLTTTDWAQHKDWLRGVKTLINLGVKRFR